MLKFPFFATVLLLSAASANGQVFINEVLLNPPGSSFDDTKEYIELMGTPGMKLDGFAVVVLNGSQQKYYPLGSIPPIPAVPPEIDEFFSLDGLTLGRNGILVIGIGTSSQYSTLLADTNFRQWLSIWNGNAGDAPAKLQNDGANTFVLMRRRPGITQADPGNPLGARWGKDLVVPDGELITPVTDPQDSIQKDQFGNGSLDRGDPDNMGGNTTDLRGASTPGDPTDDLEVVDEVSYEHDRGWEYDMDGRHVDNGSTNTGQPTRHVHALDDPQGINPDALCRVDYRTKGNGWTPVAGATGEMGNGNNWQDTATQQWVRGESIVGAGGQGSAPQIFFDNGANANPDSIQPYLTNVPTWLSDGAGADYNFAASNTYQIMAGRVNPLAVSFIPGDVDRDGDCDAADISKLAAVFGNADWIFSNSFATAPQGDSGDPAAQTRPWDVDGTGDNGVEPSDLQWSLNFQGNVNGQIVGVRYDSTTPAGTGVAINPNTGVAVTVSTSVNIPSGHAISALAVGDTVEITVRAQVTSGANLAAGQQNGVMQFVHDLAIDAGGVLKVVQVTAGAPFAKTRAALEALQGVSGDGGVKNINGHATSFTQGLSTPSSAYTVTLQAIGTGSAHVSLAPASKPSFVASTPRGIKVGHTDNNGNPATATYPASLAVSVASGACEPCDTNCDGSVNLFDIESFVDVLTPGGPAACSPCAADSNSDGSVNLFDIGPFVDCLTG